MAEEALGSVGGKSESMDCVSSGLPLCDLAVGGGDEIFVAFRADAEEVDRRGGRLPVLVAR